MESLFSNERVDFDLPDAEVLYFPNFLSGEESALLFKHLLEKTPWQHDSITLFGKTHPQPRLTAFYGAPDLSYSYSNIKMNANLWTSALLDLKNKVEVKAATTFNNVLLNLYRDGKCKIKLEKGSLLLMKGSTQHFYKHQIPKTTTVIGPRINLTFRTIIK